MDMKISQVDMLKEGLENGICRVTFTKKDGTERVMWCTQRPDLIPEEFAPKDSGRKTNDDNVTVFDLEKGAWRSFIRDNVKDWNTETVAFRTRYGLAVGEPGEATILSGV